MHSSIILLHTVRAMRPLFLLCLCVTATQAADLNTAVTQGQELPLGTYYEIDRGSCQALAAPRVRLGEKPRLGRATVVKLQRQVVQTGGRCGTMAVPAVQIRYQALQPGSDTMAWEVTYQARGAAPREIDAAIRVMPRPAPARPR